MLPEFFAKAEVGKFYHENAENHIPVYLDSDVLKFFVKRACKQRLDIEVLLNQILKREIAQIEATSR